VATLRVPCREPGRGWRAFVADSGNHVIRQVEPDGRVETLAGCPGIAGHADRSDPRLALFRDPQGVCAGILGVFVADRGNHAVRQVDLAEARLETVAGDPACSGTRWGLLRDGLPGALPPGYAALEAPATLAPGAEGTPLSLLAPTGRGLAELRAGGAVRDRVEATLGDLAPAERNQVLVVPFRAATRDTSGHDTEVPLHCTVDFIEPDGTLAARREAVLPRGGEHSLQGAFTQAGTAQVVLRAVSGQGVSAGMRRTVAVR
jgi:hypothetical protein